MILQIQIFGLEENMILFFFPRKEFAENQRIANYKGLIPFHLRATCQVSALL